MNDAAQPLNGSTEYCKPVRTAQQAFIGSSSYYKQHKPITCEGNNGKRVRYSPVRRNKPYSSNKKHLPQLQLHVFTRESRMQKWGKSLYIVENSRKERLWKKSTQHRWHIFRCNGFNSFNRKINYSFIGIYLLYYLLNRYYKCCRMLKMVLTGCCWVLKDVERVLNGVGMIKCAK